MFVNLESLYLSLQQSSRSWISDLTFSYISTLILFYPKTIGDGSILTLKLLFLFFCFSIFSFFLHFFNCSWCPGEKDYLRVMKWLRELTKPNVVSLNSSMQEAADLLNREKNVLMAFVKVRNELQKKSTFSLFLFIQIFFQFKIVVYLFLEAGYVILNKSFHLCQRFSYF